MKSLINQSFLLLQSATAKNTGITLVGNAVSSLLGIIFAMIAAYYLVPEDWGIVASVRNLINILIAVADLGLGAALFQYISGKWKEEQKTAVDTYRNIFTLRLISCLLFCILLFVLSGFVSKISFGFVDHNLVYLVVLGFAGVLLLDFQVFAIQSKQSWKFASIMIALTNIFRVGILLFLVLISQVSQINTIIAFSISGLLTFFVGLVILPYPPSFNLNISKIVSQFGKFSLWMSINKIVSTIASRIDVLLVLQTLGAYKAGMYGIASTLAIGVPIVIGSFATVLASRFASVTDVKQTKNFFFKSIGLSIAVALLLIFGVLISPLVISFFGEKYSQASPILQWLLIAMIPFVISAPAVNILIYYFKKPEIISYLSILQLFIIGGINYYFLSTLDVYAPVLAIGLSNFVTMLISYIYAFRCLTHKQ